MADGSWPRSARLSAERHPGSARPPLKRHRWVGPSAIWSQAYNRQSLMVRILVTNDDGYRSEGIHALAHALREVGDVTTVAPVLEASAIGEGVFAVGGTPSDCVNVAIAHVFKGLPDLVVSGINKGWNLGDDVTYSG